ncbi:MAG: GntR family transcriptional regulator [Clostridia bacterium]
MDLRTIAEEMQPKSMAARDWVFQVIRTAIIRGVLPGGVPLRQDEISAALSVSHIPVREAFRQLEAQGLVRIYPNRGAVVTKLTREEMSNVMDVRILLELGAIRKAMTAMTDSIIEKAEAIYVDFAEEKDLNAIEDLNLRFHFALYEPANNPIMFQYIDQLHANVDRYVRPFYSESQIHHNSNDEHRQLIDACAARDAELASAILRTHLETTKVLLLNSPMLMV